MKQKGYVKWYDFENGYGFVTTNTGDKEMDVFIHFSELQNTFLRLDEGDLIEFELVYIQDRPKAIDIRLV
jgi:CspA family cold shock protein